MKKVIITLSILIAGITFGSLLNAQTKSESDDILHYRQKLEKYRELAVRDRETYSPDVAATLFRLAELHIEREERLEALPLFEELLELAAKRQAGVLDVRDIQIELADILEDIGIEYYDRHDYNTAEKYYQRSLTFFEALAKNKPASFLPHVARLLLHIGNIYHNDRKEYRTAEKYYMRSLPIFEKLAQERPEKWSSDLSTVLRNIGLNHHELKRYGKAETYYLRSLSIREQLAQEDTDKYLPDLTILLEDMGNNFFARKNYAEAHKYYQRCLQICEQLEAEDNETQPSLLIVIYGALSWNGILAADYDNAEKFALRALELDDTQTWTKINLAHALLFQNRFSEAEEIYRESSQNEKTLTPMILDDFKALKKANAIPKNHKADVKKIKKVIS